MIVANALRELDCFLHALIDALAARSGLAGHALGGFRRRRDAAAKLSACPLLPDGGADDGRRLRQLAARQSGLRRGIAGPHRSSPAVATDAPSPVDLIAVTTYYIDLAQRLVDHDARRAADGGAPGRQPQAACPAPA